MGDNMEWPMDNKIITRDELEENITRAGEAEVVGMPEDRLNEFMRLVVNEVQLVEHLKNRIWIRARVLASDQLKDHENAGRQSTTVMIPSRLFIDLNLAVYKTLFSRDEAEGDECAT